MKLKCLILAVAILPSPATAEQGYLAVFEDPPPPSAWDIEIDDHATGTRRVYIVHVRAYGSSGSSFRYVEDPGVTMVRVSDGPVTGMLALGDLDTGVSVAYQECRIGTFPIYRIDYQALGTSAACSFLRIEPDQTSVPPGVYLYDCNVNMTIRSHGAFAIVNVEPICNPGPVAPSTWGRVKALYR